MFGVPQANDTQVEFAFYSPGNDLVFSLESSWLPGAAPTWIRSGNSGGTFPAALPPNSAPWAACDWRGPFDALVETVGSAGVTGASINTAGLETSMAPAGFHADFTIRLFRDYGLVAEAVVRGCGNQSEWIILTQP